jgi:hypothetical protein
MQPNLFPRGGLSAGKDEMTETIKSGDHSGARRDFYRQLQAESMSPLWENLRELVPLTPAGAASWLSKYVTLKPGDPIYTGTPEGVGPIARGDHLDAHIDGLNISWSPSRHFKAKLPMELM